jgi:predicted Rdx family selenoprotein
MSKPKIEIRYCGVCDMDEPEHGYLLISVNGQLIDHIYLDYTTGNDARIHMGIQSVVESVYQLGIRDGVKRSKERINDLLEWARRIDDGT